MLVRHGILSHRVNMHAAFMSKCRIPDIGLMSVGHEIRELGHEMRDFTKVRQLLPCDRFLLHLQREVRNDRR